MGRDPQGVQRARPPHLNLPKRREPGTAASCRPRALDVVPSDGLLRLPEGPESFAEIGLRITWIKIGIRGL